LENKADIDVIEAATSFSETFLQIHGDLETEVRAVIQAAQQEAQDTVLSDITWSTIRPDTGVEACCWAHGTAASLAPDDEGGANQWSDNCPPSAAVDGSTSSWWNTNYSRTVYYHTTKNTSDGGRHWITLDLQDVYNINGFTYQGRQGNTNSHINAYQIYVSEVEDLGRDPLDKNNGDHPGHHPPAAKLVHQGNFTDSTGTQTVTFAMPAYGRYVQLRPVSYYGSGGEGAAELRVIREATPGPNLLDAVNTIIADALTNSGYSSLVIDDSYLDASYQDAIQILGLIKNKPVQFNKLNALLHGSVDTDGAALAKGAAQYLNDDPDRPPETLITVADVNTFLAYQEEVDDLTRRIRLLVSALQSSLNS
jgi:hypothetical protein